MALLPIFVYGTLKRGECRAGCWPCVPRRVATAYTRGRLHDLGPYPAMVPGDDVIRGELWSIAEPDLPITLEVLDRIEGCVGEQDDAYVRVMIECWTEAESMILAYAYQYARPHTLSAFPIAQPIHGIVSWPRHPPT